MTENFFPTGGGERFRWQMASGSSYARHFHRAVPTLRTAGPACLHSLSTGLCTPQFAVIADQRETVSAVR
jgi:hypothetical protein